MDQHYPTQREGHAWGFALLTASDLRSLHEVSRSHRDLSLRAWTHVRARCAVGLLLEAPPGRKLREATRYAARDHYLERLDAALADAAAEEAASSQSR